MAMLSVVLCLIFQGCNFSGPNLSRTWINDHIDEEKRSEIQVLNKKFITGLKNDDPPAVRSMMSDSLLTISKGSIDSIIHKASPLFHVDKFSVLNEYNVVNTSTGVDNFINGTDVQGNEYTVRYTAINKDMYVSLLLVKDTFVDILVTAIYGKYGGKWKMNIFRIGQYSFYGKTGMDYYQMARRDFARSYLVSAVCDISIAHQCMTPGGQIFQYKKETEFKTFTDTVFNKIKSKYQFPLTMDGISGKPKLINIYPQMRVEGYFPLVLYKSDINLKDTVLLKTEFEKVKTEVKHLFPGIGKGNKFTLYQAYNEMPDGIHPVPYYGFVDEDPEPD